MTKPSHAIAEAFFGSVAAGRASMPRDPVGTARVMVLEGVDSLTPHADALEDLAGDLCVQNISYEPWLAIPLARACAERQRLVFMLIFGQDISSALPRLLGFFPFERSPFHSLLPLPCLRLWSDPFNYVGARCEPLIRNGAADTCIGALFDWLRHDPASPGLVDLHSLTDGTEIVHAIERHLAAGTFGHFHLTRASHLYRRHASADAYLDAVISGRGRQTLRYKARKLQELGPIEYADVNRITEVGEAIDEFIDLEARSWKGRQGVAIDPYGHRALIKAILSEAHRRGRLSLLTLRVGGALVAARCVFRAPPGSFLFKLSYDESEHYARRSPGLLLEVEAIRRLHRDDEPLGNGIAWMDTCASPNSALFSRTRSESLTIHRYAVAAPRTPAALVTRLWPLARSIRRRLSGPGRKRPNGTGTNTPLACVMGDIDMVRPLGLAGIPCAVVAQPGHPAACSRFTRMVLPWHDAERQADALIGSLMRFGTAQTEPPVLYYEEDTQLLLVSRHRERLARAFRFVIAAPELVEDLVDKARFQALAERLDLPVPKTRRLHPVPGSVPPALDLRYPLIVKPLTRRAPWK
ncbi:MAG TPA: GNAT family N-acetyltransferase, partial [Arenibaculum sp.]|nr:GNAT family N-acetyltransferase [Arenibaculum sp.]